jgi:hypothetical protein
MRSKIAFFQILFFIVFFGYAQVEPTPISEDDLSLKVIARHYDLHTGAEGTEWFVSELNDEKVYIAQFEFDKEDKEVVYNQYGRPIMDATIKNQIPVVLLDYIGERYEKFKVIEYKKTKNLETERSNHSVSIKTKEFGEVVLGFDQYFTPTDSGVLTASN